MTMLFRILRVGPVLLLITSTILLGFSAEPGKIALLAALSLEERFAKPGKAFDTPDEAQEFYRLKRAPAGQLAIPVERYIAANDQMKLMAQYTSSTNSFAPTLASWTPLGPGNIGGRTRALVVDRLNPTVMYAGGVAGGIWKSTNGGTSWNPKGDLLPNLAVCSLAMDPTNSNILYAGTGEGFFNADGVRGAGIMKSTDAGETWSQLNSTDRDKFYYVNDIVVAPSANVYAATRTGVWRSTNGGTNWSKVLAPGVIAGCLDLAIRTDQTNDYLFASCGSFEQATVYRNTNAGGSGTWTPVYTETAMGRTSLAVAPSNQNVVYGLLTDRFTSGLLAVVRSTDSGSTWASRVRNTDPTKLNTLLLTNPVYAVYADCNFNPPGPNQLFNQGWYDNVVAVDPLDQNRVWVGGIDLFRSEDGGANWGLASHWWAPTGHSHFAHADQHVILFHPDYNGGSNKKMYVANDGGIFRTDDARAATATGSTAPCNVDNGSVSWTSLNNGYGVTQFFHGLPYPNGVTYFGGTQDNGTLRGSDTGGINGWSMPIGGDGGYVAVDPTNTNILYAENIRLSLLKSNNGGGSWFSATNGITESSENFLFITPFIMDPSNSQRLWIGGNRLWRTTNGAGSWSQASAPLDDGKVSAIAIASTNPNQVLAGTHLGRIYRTDSGTTSSASTVWSSVTLRELGDYISWISIDPGNANIVYATVSTFSSNSVHHVFKSANGGASWVNIDGTGTTGIPDIPVHCIVVDPDSSSKLYVGTDLGVFVSLDGGASWNRENAGFANAVTESLAFNTVGGVTTLFAFTHGRGVWRVPVSTSPPPPPPPDSDYVSDLNFTVIANGWGPVEKDHSNGDQGAGDGGTITLNGATYSKGLGAHANSEVRVTLNGNYSTFIADVGLDDEMNSYGTVGSIVFQVWADGVKIYDSGVMNTISATKAINVSVAGKSELRLVVTDGGDNTWYDHADWAEARLVRNGAPPFDYVSDLNFTAIANGWGPVEKDHSNGDQGAGDGGAITLNGVTYAKGLGAHANSEVRVTLNGNYSTFIADVGLDDEMNSYGTVGSIVFQVWADGVKIYDSGVMNTISATKTINVSVAGKNEVRLIVTDGGDNNWYDHADWAGARLVR